MSKITIDTDKAIWMTEVEPELYSDKPNRYQVRNKRFGLYSKKEAKLICDFLRVAGYDIIHDLIV